MSRGFVYIVTSVSSKYMQRHFFNVPTEWENRLYFGPCKIPMRPKVKLNDYIFGISPASPKPRRIVFATRVEEALTFRDAYEKYPWLRGPEGPIHVKPVNRDPSLYSFPESKYEHIPGSMHSECWKKDLARDDLDVFFVCCQAQDWFGRWLGPFGPEVDRDILAFLKSCWVYGKNIESKNEAMIEKPIVYGGLTIGLHLETNDPETLEELCRVRMLSHPPDLGELQRGLPQRTMQSSVRLSQYVDARQNCDSSGNGHCR